MQGFVEASEDGSEAVGGGGEEALDQEALDH